MTEENHADWLQYMVPHSEYWRTVAGPQANKEGWDIFDTDGVLQIQRIDDPEDDCVQLDGDVAAYRHCVEQAMRGSKLHILALYLDGRPNAYEPDPDILAPRTLLE